jgi:GNAT superfamily N-acetyltransferase
MRPIGEGVGETKRMYVRPAYRRKGIGRGLLECLVQEAEGMGLATLRLDTLRSMKEARALYRSAGFREIEPYPESEIPGELWANWVFMESDLSRMTGNC